MWYNPCFNKNISFAAEALSVVSKTEETAQKVNEVEKVAQGSLKSLRKKAVRDAWKEEKELVENTGKGTREWTRAEKQQLLQNGKVKGYQGHHINNVKHHPSQAGNPNNIKFVTPKEHLLEHGGNFKNETTGELINRKF